MKIFLSTIILFLGVFNRSSHALDLSPLLQGAYSSYSSEASLIEKPQPTFSLGGSFLIGIDVERIWGFETGLTYNRISLRFNEGTHNLNYLSMPLLLRITPVPLFVAYAGPYLGVPIATHQLGTLRTELFNAAQGDSRADFGILLGGSVRTPLFGDLKLRVDLAYRLGLANLSTAGSHVYVRQILLSAGVLFDLW